MTNVTKHAEATTVSIVLECYDGCLRIIIEDDGKGFDPNEAPGPGSIGLAGMRERLGLLGGTMTINSEVGSGTTLYIRIPLGPADRKGGDAMSKIRVALADDHPVVLAGIKALIQAAPEMELVGEASDGKAALQLITATVPDVAVIDVSMPLLAGVDLAHAVNERCPAVKILVLTVHEDRAYVQQLLQAGARGYVLKRSAAEELVRAIRVVFAGDLHIDPAIASKLLSAIGSGSAAVAPGDLSQREEEVLKLTAQGFSHKEAAVKLALSIKTVETYKARAAEKLGPSNARRDRAVRCRPRLARQAVTVPFPDFPYFLTRSGIRLTDRPGRPDRRRTSRRLPSRQIPVSWGSGR